MFCVSYRIPVSVTSGFHFITLTTQSGGIESYDDVSCSQIQLYGIDLGSFGSNQGVGIDVDIRSTAVQKHVCRPSFFHPCPPAMRPVEHMDLKSSSDPTW